MLQPAGILFLIILSWAAVEAAPNDECFARGNPTTIQEVPWLVSIRAKNKHICSGVIINPKFILIAADCLETLDISEIKVRVGMTDRDSGPTERVCDETIHARHPKYFLDGNLSLLKLCQPLSLSAEVRAIEIIDKQPQKDDEGSVAGWGSLTQWRYKYRACWADYSKVLRKTDVQLMDIKECATKRKRFFFNLSTSEVNICSAKEELGCSYDAGSPLVIDGKLAGIITTGTCLAKPEIYASLFSYRKWIEDNTQD
ncbi:trypsin iota-like [Drosophila biarmipes]|uniref:trypsin iota-like n=1 Tax=Drosophila biarmipes TaxID=125945 RepID=UPI0007E8453B|nr:trypsin iota-like [Drosophila biarmipes]